MHHWKNNFYRDIPFASEFQDDIYKFYNVSELVEKCKKPKEKVIKCRTIGVLESLHGRFILRDISNKSGGSQISVSMVYLKKPLPSTVMPYVVQLFGTLQWENNPVLFVKIFEVLKIATAIRLNETLKTITNTHLANYENNE